MAEIKSTLSLDSSGAIKALDSVLLKLGDISKQLTNIFNKPISTSGTEKTKTQFEDIGKEIDKTTNKVEGLGSKIKEGFAIGAGISSFGLIQDAIGKISGYVTDAYTGFVDLNKQIANIGTLAPSLNGQALSLDLFQEKINELAKTGPDSAATIANGVYNAISAGITGTEQEIIDFVEVASKVGVAGMADTNAAVNGLTSVMNAYKMSTSDAGQVADTFFAAIKLGKTTFNELNSAIANVIPAASAAGIGFDEVAAGIAQMTALGVPTSQASTQIRAALVEIQKPGAKLAQIMKGVTVEIDGVSQELSASNIGKVLKEQGLIETLNLIEQAAAKSGKTMTQAFSSTEAASAALLLTGENAERARTTFEQVKNEIEGGVSTAAYESAAQSIEVQFKTIQNQIQGFFNDLFQTLTPFIKGSLAVLGDVFSFLAKNIQTIGIALGATLAVWGGYSLATGIATAATAAFNAVLAINPAVAIALAVGALTVGIIALVDAMGESTEEKIESNKADKEAIDNQIKLKNEQLAREKSLSTLVSRYEELGNKVNRTAAEEEEFRKTQLELIKEYPGVISSSKKFEDNLIAIKDATGLTNAEFSKVNSVVKSLAKEYETLGSKTTRTADEQKRFEDVQKQLNKEFPGVISNTKSFGENLENLALKTGDATSNTQKLRGELNALEKKSLQIQRRGLQLEITAEFENFQDEIGGDLEGKLRFAVRAIRNASKEELNNLRFQYLEYIQNSINADSKEKNEATKSLNKIISLREQELSLLEATNKAKTEGTTEEAPDTLAPGTTGDTPKTKAAKAEAEKEFKYKTKLEEALAKLIESNNKEAYNQSLKELQELAKTQAEDIDKTRTRALQAADDIAKKKLELLGIEFKAVSGNEQDIKDAAIKRAEEQFKELKDAEFKALQDKLNEEKASASVVTAEKEKLEKKFSDTRQSFIDEFTKQNILAIKVISNEQQKSYEETNKIYLAGIEKRIEDELKKQDELAKAEERRLEFTNKLSEAGDVVGKIFEGLATSIPDDIFGFILSSYDSSIQELYSIKAEADKNIVDLEKQKNKNLENLEKEKSAIALAIAQAEADGKWEIAKELKRKELALEGKSAEEIKKIMDEIEENTEASAKAEEKAREKSYEKIGVGFGVLAKGIIDDSEKVKEQGLNAIFQEVQALIMKAVMLAASSVAFPFNIPIIAGATLFMNSLYSELKSKIVGRLHGGIVEGGTGLSGMTTSGQKFLTINENGKPEYVVNAQATKKYKSLLDTINSGKDPNSVLLKQFADSIGGTVIESTGVEHRLDIIAQELREVKKAQLSSYSRSAVAVEMEPLKVSGNELYTITKKIKKRSLKG